MTSYLDQTGMEYFLKSYNMKEARMRQNLTQEQVELFRTKAKDSKIIPKVIVDSQVDIVKYFSDFVATFTSSDSPVHQLVSRRC